jgi:hypothetical protein
VRALLAVAVVDYLEVEQLDVKTAFLNGELEEIVWADQPEGFEVGEFDQKLKLKKALYGMKQAPRAWYLKLAAGSVSLWVVAWSGVPVTAVMLAIPTHVTYI